MILHKWFHESHKLLVTAVMKMYFPKSKPSIITYKSYKKFDNKKFMENVNAEIIIQSNYLEKDSIDAFSSI